METLLTIVGLAMYVSQIRGIVILFGGHKKAPNRLRIIIGIGMMLMTLGVYGLSMGY